MDIGMKEASDSKKRKIDTDEGCSVSAVSEKRGGNDGEEAKVLSLKRDENFCLFYTTRPVLQTFTQFRYLRHDFRFDPFFRGHLLLHVVRRCIPDDSEDHRQWYAIPFCVGNHIAKRPLGDIELIFDSNREDPINSSRLDLEGPYRIYSACNVLGLTVACLSKKVGVGEVPGWTTAPQMLGKRLQPHSVSLDGKLYVMGGRSYFEFSLSKEELGPWGEIFDPCTMQWKPMTDPPLFPHDDHLLTASIEEERKILMAYNGYSGIFSFDIDKESWDLYHRPRDNASLPITGQCVVSRGVLYSLDHQHFLAYDLRNGYFVSATPTLMGLVGDGYPATFVNARHLYHLGNNNLCLLGMLDDYRSAHCVVFEPFIRINRNGNPYLDVILKGQEVYKVGASEEMILPGVIVLK